MSTDTRIQELIQLWREAGTRRELAVEELCRDWPELIEEVRPLLASLSVSETPPSGELNRSAPVHTGQAASGHAPATLCEWSKATRWFTDSGSGGFGYVWKAIAPGNIPIAMKFVRLDPLAPQPERRSLEVVRNLRIAAPGEPAPVPGNRAAGLSWRWSCRCRLAIVAAVPRRQGASRIPLPELLRRWRKLPRGSTS